MDAFARLAKFMGHSDEEATRMSELSFAERSRKVLMWHDLYQSRIQRKLARSKEAKSAGYRPSRSRR